MRHRDYSTSNDFTLTLLSDETRVHNVVKVCERYKKGRKIYSKEKNIYMDKTFITRGHFLRTYEFMVYIYSLEIYLLT